MNELQTAPDPEVSSTAVEAAPPEPSNDRPFLIRLALLSAAAGLIARIPAYLGASAPLGGGGFEYRLTRDLGASWPGIPFESTYNQAHIPFAYPPLGLYVALFVQRLTGLSLLSIQLYLPLVLNLASVALFAILAVRLLRSRFAASVAAVSFAVVPSVSDWLISGEGLTRGWAYLFGIAGVLCLVDALERESPVRSAAAGVLGGFALLSHPEAAWFVLTIPLLLLAFSLSAKRAGLLALALAVCVAVALPWVGFCSSRYGWSPFQAYFREGAWRVSAIYQLLALRYMGEGWLPWLGACGIAGAYLALKRCRWFLPVWFIALAYAIPTPGLESSAWLAIPAALLTGWLLGEALSAGRSRWPGRLEASIKSLQSPTPFAACFALVALFAVTPFYRRANLLATRQFSKNEVAAIGFIANRIPAGRPVLLYGPWTWRQNAVADWLPALSGQAFPLTPQGSEWLPGSRHSVLLSLSIQTQVPRTAAEATKLASLLNAPGAVVAIVQPPLEDRPLVGGDASDPDQKIDALAQDLAQSREYRIVFANPTSLVAIPNPRGGR